MFINLYLKTRKYFRDLIIKNNFENKFILFLIVKIDLYLRKLGLLKKYIKSGEININGFIFYFGASDVGIAETLITNKDYELDTRKIIEKILTPNSVFFDLGANIGLHSIFASRQISENGKIYSFEPSPETFNYLLKNIKSNSLEKKIIAENLAITNIKGQAPFLITKNSECNSITNNKNYINNNSLIFVNTISIDEYCDIKNINNIDLVKMDIEGQELNAMKSMINIVSKSPNFKIIFELHDENLINNNEDSLEVLNFLSSIGLKYFMLIGKNPIFFTLNDNLSFLGKQLKIYNINILASKYPLFK